MDIEAGTVLEVVTASGERVRMRALDQPRQGHDFRVVWVCTEQEFKRARQTGERPRGIPWPYHALRVLEQLTCEEEAAG